jgi:multicomponent Na+:H+ antiporter subunit D
MPISALMAIIAGLSAIGAPGFAGFAGFSVIGAAVGQEGRALAWFALAAASAGAVLHAGLRAPYEVFFGRDKGARPPDADFTLQMAMGLAAFFCVAIGVSPGWLYGLLPEQILFHPYEGAGALSRVQLIVFAALAFALAKAFGVYPTARSGDIADVDWLYRVPGRILGSALVRAFGWLNDAVQAGAMALGRRWRALAAAGLAGADRPARAQAMSGAWLLACAALLLVFLYLFQA